MTSVLHYNPSIGLRNLFNIVFPALQGWVHRARDVQTMIFRRTGVGNFTFFKPKYPSKDTPHILDP